MNKQPCVYLLASRRNGTLYVGVTSNLVQRVWQHRNNVVDGSRSNTASTPWFGTKSMTAWKARSCGKSRSRDGGGPRNWN